LKTFGLCGGPYNGVHGDPVLVDLAAACALDLEVPGVINIGRDQLGDVLKLGFDLEGEDGLVYKCGLGARMHEYVFFSFDELSMLFRVMPSCGVDWLPWCGGNVDVWLLSLRAVWIHKERLSRSENACDF
jgi:hypothetical protein